ncbi:MAG TPA: type II 3-dehydroquinate dehydratase [Gammaproteobacteria bacterium]|nr:type II 3-dehydroquinate dehydratase [Gammaproteobacteria bacterium]
MKKILLLNGPNLNLLGKRDMNHYGTLTLKNIEELVIQEALKFNCDVITYQSNHEGYLIDKIQENREICLGIIINPGALTHYSYAIHDALLDTKLPVIEVHLSDISQREAFRKTSVISDICLKTISGKKEVGYIDAVHVLLEDLKYD